MSASNEVLIRVSSQNGGRFVRATMPEGYYRVLSGALKPTDLFYSANAESETGNPWSMIGDAFFAVAGLGELEHYLCVIRKGTPVDVPCQRCHARPVCDDGMLLEMCEECYGKLRKS